MFCRFCGKELKDGVKFCANCGAKVESESLPSASVDIGFKTNPYVKEITPEEYLKMLEEEKAKKPNTFAIIVIDTRVITVVGLTFSIIGLAKSKKSKLARILSSIGLGISSFVIFCILLVL